MYWIYLIIFILAVLSPDIIAHDIYFLSQKRAEELLIFILGVIGFIFFTRANQQLYIQRKEKDTDQKRINQTVKDLVESYSYIGEVNRKMDILMNISLGLTEKSNLSKNKQNEIYQTIIDAAKFLMKANCVVLKFISVKDHLLKKEVKTTNSPCILKSEMILKIKESEKTKKYKDFLWTFSHNKIKDIRCYLIVGDYEEQDDKTIEMLRVLASQALFVYSYAGQILD